MAHSTINCTSSHLWLMLAQLAMTTRNQQSFPSAACWQEAARHGPALGVTPVFIPFHPLHNILLVFSQLIVLLSAVLPKYVSTLQEYNFVLTILRISVFCKAFLQSLHISYIVVLFCLLESPCGFAHEVFSMPNQILNLFIRPKYRMILLLHSTRLSTSYRSQILFTFPNSASLRIVPPTKAIWQAASFPLGSIIAQRRSSKLTTSLFLKDAVVPIMVVANSLIAIFIYFGFKLCSLASAKIATKFIILVRLATSIRFLDRSPYINLSDFIQYTAQYLELTDGGFLPAKLLYWASFSDDKFCYLMELGCLGVILRQLLILEQWGETLYGLEEGGRGMLEKMSVRAFCERAGRYYLYCFMSRHERFYSVLAESYFLLVGRGGSMGRFEQFSRQHYRLY